MAAVTAGAPRTMDLGLRGPAPARTTGPAAADRSPAAARPGRTVRSWPLLVLAAPAAAEVWSGWVGIAQKTGFGLVSPLPGIWPSLHLDTVHHPAGRRRGVRGVRAARLAGPRALRSATGPAGSPSGPRSAPSRSAWPGRWPTTCWPRPGRHGRRGPSPPSCPACRSWSWPWGPRWPTCCAPTPPRMPGTTLYQDQQRHGPRTRSARDRHAPDQDQTVGGGSGPPVSIRKPATRERDVDMGTTSPESRDTPPRIGQARLVARTLAAAGKPASRRALRDAGVKGSNESLNALARRVNAELAGRKKSP